MAHQDSDLERPLLHSEGPGPHVEEHPAGDSSHGASGPRGWLSEQLRAGPPGLLLRESPSDLGGAAAVFVPAGYQQGPKLSARTAAHRHTAAASTRARRSAWIVIDENAKRSFLHADKRSLIMQLGINIPIRDMRLLDFNLLSSETGKLLVRDNAIILSIEHVRLIITADKVLVPREGYEHNPLSNRFVDVLEEAIAEWVRQRNAGTRPMSIDSPGLMMGGTGHGHGLGGGAASAQHSDYEDDHSSGVLHAHDSQQLPFELVALEAALKEVVNAAGLQVKELEGVALPALDALTKSVSTGNLERVRKVKTRHQRLMIRCETLRDELERFLHDDDDMVKMCLTRRKELEEQYRAAERAAAQQQLDGGGDAAASAGGGGGQRAEQQQQQQQLTPVSLAASHRTRLLVGLPSLARSSVAAAVAGVSSPSGRTASFARESAAVPMLSPGALEEELTEDAAEDVENLLESYFAQVDAHYDKLRNIGEYIEDTEEYINIELDAGRNRLIRLDIVLTAASFAIAPFNLLAGILGENLVIPPFLTEGVSRFYVLNATAFCMCFLFFYSIILYMRWRKLI